MNNRFHNLGKTNISGQPETSLQKIERRKR